MTGDRGKGRGGGEGLDCRPKTVGLNPDRVYSLIHINNIWIYASAII